MATFAHDMPWGAQFEDGRVRFRLWAPRQHAPKLILESEAGERNLAMRECGRGWFELRSDAARVGSRYRYALDEGLRVPDPASRFQADDVHGASVVVDPRAYEWREPEWRGRFWRETVLYEAHAGTFGASGDYDGLRRRLDTLVDLGITALELMPIAHFEGQRGWGYDGVLLFAPQPAYGSVTQLKRLVDAAHERELMMFLDVVYNHFGPSGNYLGRYAPQFFSDRYCTPWGEAIDFSRREVRDFYLHNALFWLEEYRFDGLRFDAVDRIHDASAKHILVELAEAVRARIRDREVHLVLENDDNAARYLDRAAREDLRLYDAQWNDDWHHAAHVLATGETPGYYRDYDNEPAASLARALAEGFGYQGEYSAHRGRRRGEASAALPSTAFVNFLQNHDQIGNRACGERLNRLAKPAALDALVAILLLAPQIPLLFMGEEWGANEPFYYFCDYRGELAAKIREGRRSEFARFPAFADPAARARIPDPSDEASFVASRLDWTAAEHPAAKRRREYVRALLAIRRNGIVPHLPATNGRYHVARRALAVTWNLTDGSLLHLLANPADSPAPDLDWPATGEMLFTASADPGALREQLPQIDEDKHASPMPERGNGRINMLPPWTVIWLHET